MDGELERAPRVAIVVNHDWFFLSHRLPIALAARRAGAHITVVAGDSGQAATIRGEGLDFVRLPILPQGTNPLKELGTLGYLVRLYRRMHFDLVHHVTPKPVLYGSLAARFSVKTAVVNTISGLGYAFSSKDLRARVLRPLIRTLYRAALSHPRSKTVFQNCEDLREFRSDGLIRGDQAVLIKGSGVNCSIFQPSPEPSSSLTVVLASRMLWDKGVAEFVTAARLIRERGKMARFILVGRSDPGNPSAIPIRQLEEWHREGTVEWWGHRDDMPAVMSKANVVVLPTKYGEGVPKVLLEAAASARPIVASDIRGCREIVRNGTNGILVPPSSTQELARAIDQLLDAPQLRAQFGRAGRNIALQEFAEDLVIGQMMDVYRGLLQPQ